MSASRNKPPDWVIRASDGAKWHGLQTMEGLFTTLHIVFEDVESGERHVVTRHNAEAAAKYGVFEKLVRAAAPMKQEDAEAVADRIMPVLSGGTPDRFFATLDADQHLVHRSGEQHP